MWAFIEGSVKAEDTLHYRFQRIKEIIAKNKINFQSRAHAATLRLSFKVFGT